ncbi:MAG: phospholipase C [Solirubrobacteraceae bacterium]
MSTAAMNRRALLGAAAVLATGSLPVWKRLFADAGQMRKPDSRPFPHLPPGHESMPAIKHVVVLMMENRSFDNLLGLAPFQAPGRERLDGLTRARGQITNFNRDATGTKVFAHVAPSPCPSTGLRQDWNASHLAYNNGRNDGFVRATGPVAMELLDGYRMPFTYSLARHFPVGQRYFSSVLAQTAPNRRFLFTGTASGIIATNGVTFKVPAPNGTIFDRLDAHRIEWANYFENVPSMRIVPDLLTKPGRSRRLHHFSEFAADARAGRLPQFTFIDPNYTTTSEEDPQDVQVGERFVAEVVHELIRAPTWQQTALFITYDEGGGYYDHVPPPRAIKPDSTPPMLAPDDIPGAYDRYGFRVPTIVVSPWAKPGYVSNIVQDHTSILAFIERKWNLPPMTFRDANAHPMTDYFDFSRPAFAKPPVLHRGPELAVGITECHARGLTPPLP